MASGGRRDLRSEPESDTRRVQAVFGLRPASIDELVPRTGFSVERVLVALTRLELSGLIRRSGEGWSPIHGEPNRAHR